MWAVFSGYERAVSDCLVSDCLWTVIERFRIRFMASSKRQAFPHLEFKGDFFLAEIFEKVSSDPYNFPITFS